MLSSGRTAPRPHSISASTCKHTRRPPLAAPPSIRFDVLNGRTCPRQTPRDREGIKIAVPFERIFFALPATQSRSFALCLSEAELAPPSRTHWANCVEETDRNVRKRKASVDKVGKRCFGRTSIPIEVGLYSAPPYYRPPFRSVLCSFTPYRREKLAQSRLRFTICCSPWQYNRYEWWLTRSSNTTRRCSFSFVQDQHVFHLRSKEIRHGLLKDQRTELDFFFNRSRQELEGTKRV